MARTTATNFSGGLQFPYANAPADLFKKEDVQVLAQAVDQHDHSTGKGIVIPFATAIPSGTITSAMIADGTIQAGDIGTGQINTGHILDGTIQTQDMAAYAAQQLLAAYATVPTFSSTTLSTPLTVVSLAFTSSSNAQNIRIEATGTFVHSATNGQWYVGLQVDGAFVGGFNSRYLTTLATAPASFSLINYFALAAGAHTATIVVQNNVAGTLSADNVYFTLYVTEQKR